MRAAGVDVEQEELAVEDHVVAGEEALDARVDLDAGLLPADQTSLMRVIASRSEDCRVGSRRSPNARLRFCSACVAAPLSRLSIGRDHDQAAAVVRQREAADLDVVAAGDAADPGRVVDAHRTSGSPA